MIFDSWNESRMDLWKSEDRTVSVWSNPLELLTHVLLVGLEKFWWLLVFPAAFLLLFAHIEAAMHDQLQNQAQQPPTGHPTPSWCCWL